MRPSASLRVVIEHAVRLPELLDGPRFVLRRWRVEDAPALSGAVERNIDHLRPWMPWIAGEPLTEVARAELIEGWDRQWRDGGDAVYAILAGDAVLGSCGLHRRGRPDSLEIGYWVDKDHVRTGVGTELARRLTGVALAVPGITSVEIRHRPDNSASAGIPRRLGYRLDGTDDLGHSIWRMGRSGWSDVSRPAPSR